MGPQLLPENARERRVQNEYYPVYDPQTGNLNTNCTNSNFSLGNFNNWTGCYGLYNINCNCQVQGFLTTGAHPLHKIIPAPGWLDRQTCSNLSNVFPGEAFVARLGDTMYTGNNGTVCNRNIKKEAEMRYAVTVSSGSYLFIYRYAVILQTGGHSPPSAYQPDFKIEITDNDGNVLDSTCGYYYITAQLSGPPVPGWNRCQTVPSGDVYWKDWTTVGMNLSQYLGQTVYVNFKVRGCSYDTHFGYAYISAYCSSLQIQTALCEGQSSATLSAPPGFSSYLWSTGATTSSITVPNPVTGATYWVKITAYNGCSDTIWNSLTYTVVNANFTSEPDCPGSASVFTDSSTVNQNQVVSWTWDWGDGSAIQVTSDSSVTHTFTNPGTFQVKMVAHSTEGCTDTIIKPVTIDTLAVMTNTPTLKTICSGDHANVNLTSNVTGALFTWTATAQYPSTTTGYHDRLVPSLYLNDTIFNNGLLPDTLKYLVKSHNSTCTGPDEPFRVVVLPKPSLGNTILSQEVCSGAASSAVTLIPSPGPPAVVTFDWTAYPSSPLLSGFIPAASGTLSIPSQSIINSTGMQQYVDDSIIPYLQAAQACPGDKTGYRILINPLPVPVISGPASVCANATGVMYTTASYPGHTYQWTITGAASFTGNGSSTVTVNWGSGLMGTLKVVETDMNLPTNCSTTSAVYTVTLNPNPVPVISGNQTPCGLTQAVYTLGSQQTGHTYSWTVSGGTPSAGSSSSINVTWGNTNPISINAVETINYAGGVNCQAQAPPFPLTLIPVPLQAGPISGTTPVCNTWTRNYSVAAIPNADSYTWWYLPPSGVTINNGGTSADISFDLTAGSGNLYVKGNRSGCASGPASPAFMITVNPLPYISLLSCNDPKTTTNSRPFYLKGGIPPGGKYYLDGTEVVSGLLDPSVIAPTVHQITYRYTDRNTCTSISSSVPLTVLAGSSLSSCPFSVTDPRNGTTYRTSLKGGRCWMLENLDYGSKLDPDNQPQSDNCTVEKYCSPSDAGCTAYGGFYQWDELMQYRTPAAGEQIQGLCPPEWHVPTSSEWQMLIDSQTNPGNGIAGGDLKDPNPAFGFKALLSGFYYQNSSWNFNAGGLKAVLFWTSTSAGANRIETRGLNNMVESVQSYQSLKSNAFPVRCVKNY